MVTDKVIHEYELEMQCRLLMCPELGADADEAIKILNRSRAVALTCTGSPLALPRVAADDALGITAPSQWDEASGVRATRVPLPVLFDDDEEPTEPSIRVAGW